MPKKILFLEDDGVMRTRTAGFLENDGYEIETFRRIDQANEYLEDHADEVGCIITDLNMDDEWLGDYQKESNGCLFSGWIWLQHFIFENLVHTNLHTVPCIIYSGYNTELKAEFSRINWRSRNVSFVDKGGDNNQGYDELKKTVMKVFPK